MKIKRAVSIISTVLVSTIFILIISISIISSLITLYLVNIMKKTNSVDIEDVQFKSASCIYEINPDTGEYELIYKKLGNNNDIKLSVILSSLPDYVADAFICTEDERFYNHEGVDYRRTFSAFANEFINMYNSKHGGSTITQQLIKNITNDNETTWERKIREIFRAVKLEQKYTKDEILNAYLNTIYFGQDENGANLYGIEAAAIGYFGKHASKLTIAEAASLAAIPQNPYYENPVKNYKLNQERRDYSLRKMFELGKISSDQYTQALNEKVLVTNMDEFKKSNPDCEKFAQNDFINPAVNSWAVDTAIYEFRDYIAKKYNYSDKRALDEFYNGGYDLYITTNRNIQNELQKNYLDWTFFPEQKDEKGEPVQSSFVVLDYYGQILGICGGIGEKTSSLCWNHATMTHRQPGSTIKPVSTYGYGIENNLVTWSSMFIDAPLDAGIVTEDKWPENYDNYWSFKSNTLHFFLKKSYNTIPAHLCLKFGTKQVFDFATEKMHLTLDPDYDIDYAPLSVGATNKGPTLLNMTNSYIPYGNGGKYYEAHIISRAIDTAKNKVIIEHNASDYQQVVGEDTAYIMNKLLQNVVDPDQPDNNMGTGVNAHLQNKTVAGKTGTTQNWRDISFIGLTEDFVSGIWIGYANGENENAIKSTKSATIWKNVFGNFANEYKSNAQYPESLFVKECYYCTETGLLANEDCPKSDKPGYYKNGYNEYCTKH